MFDGFEDLDVFGPLNVLAVAGAEVALVSCGEPRQVVSAHGSRVVPVRPLGPGADVVVVPGGGWTTRAPQGAWAQAQRGELPRALAALAADGTLLASVCTGALLLGAAGLLRGRPAVTNAGALADLAAAGAIADPAARVVDDGDVVTSGGLTAGIDLGLWLVERFAGAARAREVARDLEHTPRGPVRRPLPAATGLLAQVAGVELPTTPLARAAYAAAREAEEEFLLNHSVRSYLFARLAAASRGWAAGEDYDDELLFAACVLHDLGLTAAADTGARFEVDGADAAVALLRSHGVAEPRAALVWDAIALHTSAGIAERKQPEVALARAGIGMDFGRGAEIVPRGTAAAVHAALPRLDLARSITDAIVEQARGRAGKTPPGSLAADLVRERGTPPCTTWLERLAATGRWGG
ncbi:hypothetical protein NUM3379_36710 [Kineococcus sp. NUM-3379]